MTTTQQEEIFKNLLSEANIFTSYFFKGFGEPQPKKESSLLGLYNDKTKLASEYIGKKIEENRPKDQFYKLKEAEQEKEKYILQAQKIAQENEDRNKATTAKQEEELKRKNIEDEEKARKIEALQKKSKEDAEKYNKEYPDIKVPIYYASPKIILEKDQRIVAVMEETNNTTPLNKVVKTKTNIPETSKSISIS